MYEIKKTANIVDDIRISEGERELIVHVDINVMGTLKNFHALRKELAIKSERIQKEPESEEALEQFGIAIVDFFTCLFGERTKDIIEFYNGDYAQMLGDFSGYIKEELLPRINEAEQELIKKYKGFKK